MILYIYILRLFEYFNVLYKYNVHIVYYSRGILSSSSPQRLTGGTVPRQYAITATLYYFTKVKWPNFNGWREEILGCVVRNIETGGGDIIYNHGTYISKFFPTIVSSGCRRPNAVRVPLWRSFRGRSEADYFDICTWRYACALKKYWKVYLQMVLS